MNTVFGSIPADAKTPVRASKIATNGIRVSFFKQTIYRKQLPEALGNK